ncbi:hypothetical protein [Flavobacterium pectinovorum]|uniref:hypothetical protein n=1 Tax=Flavobacterium pectinovorum TaxID=29533 RepID=UPI001FAC1C39|nr:hypothetical protein [Flavobacterium pectinovorum]MCI9843971.1 hypothetical protein [Flavobacterium pectinovorum]
MEKTILNSPIEKIYPPGKCIKKATKNKLTQKPVSFPENNTQIPFSPIVQATFTDSETLQVRAVFLVSTNTELNNDKLEFMIYQNWYVDLEGNRQLQFFITYDIDDAIGKDFDIYEISFKAEKDPYGEDAFKSVKTIQTFLWDIDPETSRGTETSVVRT